jgi:hypothetical protein
MFPAIYGVLSQSTDFIGAYDDIPDLVHLYEPARRGLTAYTGPLVDVFRDSDSAIETFGCLPNGDLDKAAITTWAAGAGVFVDKVHDQIGSNDISFSNRPQLVLNGQNNRPVMRFASPNAGQVTFSGALSQPFHYYVATRNTGSIYSSSGGGSRYIVDGNGTPRTIVGARVATPITDWFINSGSNLIDGDSDNIFNVWATLFNGGSSQLFINGVQVATGNAGAGNPSSLNVGVGNTGSGFHWIGDIAMFAIADPSHDNTEREAMETAISGYWTAMEIIRPAENSFYQRDGASEADIAVSGWYGTGTPTAIEYQLDGGSWAMLDASPSSGFFSGVINNIAAGDHTISVRWSNNTSKTASVENVRVGDVFGWIGQSNAAGRFTNGQAYTGAFGSYSFDQGGVFRPIESNYKESDETTFSVLPLLASLIEADQEVPLLFIDIGESASGLLNGEWEQAGGEYTEFINAFRASGAVGIRAICWYQGERDAAVGETQADYQTAESLMIDTMQADLVTTADLISANIALYVGEPDADINAIRLAKINRWVNDADIHPGPTGHDQNFGDGLHWRTDAEALTLAGRWWRTISAALYGGTEAARGPQFVSAIRSGVVVTVTFTGGEGNLQSQTDPTGFKFTDNGTPITINSSSANGTNAVDLVLNGTPSGTELISFASGNDAVGATLSDSGTYPLPPEPFVDEVVT